MTLLGPILAVASMNPALFQGAAQLQHHTSSSGVDDFNGVTDAMKCGFNPAVGPSSAQREHSFMIGVASCVQQSVPMSHQQTLKGDSYGLGGLHLDLPSTWPHPQQQFQGIPGLQLQHYGGHGLSSQATTSSHNPNVRASMCGALQGQQAASQPECPPGQAWPSSSGARGAGDPGCCVPSSLLATMAQPGGASYSGSFKLSSWFNAGDKPYGRLPTVSGSTQGTSYGHHSTLPQPAPMQQVVGFKVSKSTQPHQTVVGFDVTPPAPQAPHASHSSDGSHNSAVGGSSGQCVWLGHIPVLYCASLLHFQIPGPVLVFSYFARAPCPPCCRTCAAVRPLQRGATHLNALTLRYPAGMPPLCDSPWMRDNVLPSSTQSSSGVDSATTAPTQASPELSSLGGSNIENNGMTGPVLAGFLESMMQLREGEAAGAAVPPYAGSGGYHRTSASCSDFNYAAMNLQDGSTGAFPAQATTQLPLRQMLPMSEPACQPGYYLLSEFNGQDLPTHQLPMEARNAAVLRDMGSPVAPRVESVDNSLQSCESSLAASLMDQRGPAPAAYGGHAQPEAGVWPADPHGMHPDAYGRGAPFQKPYRAPPGGHPYASGSGALMEASAFSIPAPMQPAPSAFDHALRDDMTGLFDEGTDAGRLLDEMMVVEPSGVPHAFSSAPIEFCPTVTDRSTAPRVAYGGAGHSSMIMRFSAPASHGQSLASVPEDHRLHDAWAGQAAGGCCACIVLERLFERLFEMQHLRCCMPLSLPVIRPQLACWLPA